MTDDLLDEARQAARSARMLLSAGDHDGAVNRAYYAMFYGGQAALEHHGVEVTSSKHGTLVRRFGQHLVKPGQLPRGPGTSLSRTLELRHQADYGRTRIEKARVERAVSEADAFVQAVERFLRTET